MRLAAALGPFVPPLAAGAAGAQAQPARDHDDAQLAGAPTSELRVGIVVRPVHPAGRGRRARTLARSQTCVVLVSNEAAALLLSLRAARSSSSHFASSARARRRPVGNLVGTRSPRRTGCAIAGMVAGRRHGDAGATAPCVAWVGPQNRHRPLLPRRPPAIARGNRAGRVVLSISGAARKRPLAGIDRGAMVVAADRGLCRGGGCRRAAAERARVAARTSSRGMS